MMVNKAKVIRYIFDDILYSWFFKCCISENLINMISSQNQWLERNSVKPELLRGHCLVMEEDLYRADEQTSHLLKYSLLKQTIKKP